MRTELHVVLLAGGDGRRLRGRAKDPHGRPAPKQYCDLGTGRPLIAAALDRALSIAPHDRVHAVIAEDHRAWWSGALDALPRENVIVQPHNRGTAPGVLLPVLQVAARVPEAVVAMLPSDHHVEDEPAFRASILDAVAEARRRERDVVLIGMRPGHADESYGWIVPEPAAGGAANAVAAFVEKPGAEEARRLLATGALWNSFTFCGRAAALLGLFEAALPWLLDEMRGALSEPDPDDAIRRLYPAIEPADFSRDVLQILPERLRVLAAPPCGWTDLGTPERLDALLDARTRRAA